jgi:hypothetical protein
LAPLGKFQDCFTVLWFFLGFPKELPETGTFLQLADVLTTALERPFFLNELGLSCYLGESTVWATLSIDRRTASDRSDACDLVILVLLSLNHWSAVFKRPRLPFRLCAVTADESAADETGQNSGYTVPNRFATYKLLNRDSLNPNLCDWILCIKEVSIEDA